MSLQVVKLLSMFILLVSVRSYFLDQQSNCSNVEGVMNTSHVTYLGRFDSTQACIQECINKKCDSYTYYISDGSKMNTTAGQCWGYINNTIWLPYPTKQSNCGRVIYPCTSHYDCSFNGECDTVTGNCTCRAGWNGYKCHFLSLEPANKSAGYLSPFGSTKQTSWGGAVAYDAINDKYVMLVTDMQNNCGINSWRRNSEIIYAQTQNTNWNSKYIKQSTLLLPFSSTPDLIYAPDTDEFVLLYVVNTTWNEIPPCVCTDGSTPSSCDKHQNVTESTAFVTIKPSDLSNGYNIDKWSHPVYIKAIGHPDSNFAAVINDDSSLIGMKRDWKPSFGSIPYLVTASNWKDNTTYKVQANPLFPDVNTEDIYIYKDCDGYYHALFHNMQPNFDQSLCGAHAFSMDGIHWQYGGYAFGNKVQFSDGSQYVFKRRERPHLIFDVKDGCTPVALTSAVEYGGVSGDQSYTLIQPIKR
eukprot:190017_1